MTLSQYLVLIIILNVYLFLCVVCVREYACVCMQYVFLSMYRMRIALNYSPGVYFFRAIFHTGHQMRQTGI